MKNNNNKKIYTHTFFSLYFHVIRILKNKKKILKSINWFNLKASIHFETKCWLNWMSIIFPLKAIKCQHMDLRDSKLQMCNCKNIQYIGHLHLKINFNPPPPARTRIDRIRQLLPLKKVIHKQTFLLFHRKMKIIYNQLFKNCFYLYIYFVWGKICHFFKIQFQFERKMSVLSVIHFLLCVNIFFFFVIF